MNSFIAELKRRNVFNVTAGYAVVGWLLMQLAAVLESSLHLPIWFDTLTTALVLIGFPIAVLLSWIFQFSHEGIKRTLKNPIINDATHSQNTLIVFSLSGLIAAGLIALMWQHLRENDFIDGDKLINKPLAEVLVEANSSPANASIAVLPFNDFSESNDQSYFGNGISEELLNVLSRVSGLRVVSRTSSFAFIGKAVTLSDIADALGVAHILEGSVRKSVDTIRITAQLINAKTDEHIWSQTYDRALSAKNLFAVQDEIASAIAAQLKSKLTVMPMEASDKTLSLQAYELYLEARENKKLRTSESLALALDGYTQVIDLDPLFAPAYSGLSDTYLLMEVHAGLDKQVSQDKASLLIAKALELAPNSAEVLASAAYLASDQKTADSIKKAEKYALKAITMNQNHADAYFMLGKILWNQGRLEEAITHFKQAITLDPLSAIILVNLAQIYLDVDDQANAKSIGEDLIRLHPSLPFGYDLLADVALKEGEYAIAHALSQDAYALNQQSTVIKNNLWKIYNLTGLYQHALWYQNNPKDQVWFAIYTNDLAAAEKELPKVKKMTDIGEFLYYLRDYAKTKQILSGYLNAYKLLDRPIGNPASADVIIAFAKIQKALGEDNSQAIQMLAEYFTPKRFDDVNNSRELEQRALLATLTGNYAQSYQWIDRMLTLEYILMFADPIFDDIKQFPEFKARQKSMQQLRDKYQLEIKAQLTAQKPNWILREEKF
jgi:TolB-like protein